MNKKNIVIVIVVVSLFVLCGIGIGTYYILKSSDKQAAQTSPQTTTTKLPQTTTTQIPQTTTPIQSKVSTSTLSPQPPITTTTQLPITTTTQLPITTTTTQPPTTTPIPVLDCVYNYRQLTNCSKPCGGGEQTFLLEVSQYPSNGGKPCPLEGQITKPCNTFDCLTYTNTEMLRRWDNVNVRQTGRLTYETDAKWLSRIISQLSLDVGYDDFDINGITQRLSTTNGNVLSGINTLNTDVKNKICDAACKRSKKSPMCVCTPTGYGYAIV